MGAAECGKEFVRAVELFCHRSEKLSFDRSMPVKSRSQVLSICAVLALALAGCGGVESDSQQPQVTEPSAEGQPSMTPQEGAQTQAPQDEGQVEAMGKRCNASCSVVSVGGTSCPATIGGTGSTSFLGGCNKACNKAEGDAASKLPPGCAINVCNFSGC
jgi:hypothetical protein